MGRHRTSFPSRRWERSRYASIRSRAGDACRPASQMVYESTHHCTRYCCCFEGEVVVGRSHFVGVEFDGGIQVGRSGGAQSWAWFALVGVVAGGKGSCFEGMS